MNLYVQESYANETAGHGLGESPIYETCSDDTAYLFRMYRRDNGAPSKMFVDSQFLGRSVHCGWVFSKTERYTDTGEKYRHETWVHLFEVCEQGDARALQFCRHDRPTELPDGKSLRTLDIVEYRKRK